MTLKKIKVALSAESAVFNCNKVLEPEWAAKFPGASWMPILKNSLEPKFEVVTADVALRNIEQGDWVAGEVFVIQHVHDSVAHALVAHGATPLILTCLESPLYVGAFYDQIASIAPKYKYRILFSGLQDHFSKEKGLDYCIRFPSYFLSSLNYQIPPWQGRKFMVAVIGNKYLTQSILRYFRNPCDLIWFIRQKLGGFLRSGSFTGFSSKKFKAEKIQLQDLRLRLISFFLKSGDLDLYGNGWNELKNLPTSWRVILEPLLIENSPKPCLNKLATIRNYKFSLCIENAQFPGYITEKIIECFVAGVIPIYMGAPDIDLIIPSECLIDFRNFKNLNDLLDYLQDLRDDEAIMMINAGRKFITSAQGRLYSYEGFSEIIENIIRIEYQEVI